MEHKQISCGSIVPTISPKYPWFVADDDGTQTHFFFNLPYPLSHNHLKIPELVGKRIRGCFFGCWALLSSIYPTDVMWCLWNPITSQIINFPPLILQKSEEDHGDVIYCCCLSAPPDHPDSVLLLTRAKKYKFVYCSLGHDSFFPNTQRKELRWTEMTYAQQIMSITGFDGWLHSLTCCNGKLYAYIDRMNKTSRMLLVEVDVMVKYHERKKITKLSSGNSKDSRREVVITLLPILEFPLIKPFGFSCFRMIRKLKGSCTELFTILIGFKGMSMTVGSVKVLKLDMDNKTWEEIDDLEDTMFTMELIADSSPELYSSAIASSEFGGYVHIFCDKGNFLYSYHVKDKTLSVSSGPYLAGSNHLSMWEMPECTRLEDAHAQIVERSVKCNHEVNFKCTKDYSHLLLPASGYKCRLESDHAEFEQEKVMHNDIIVRPVNEDELHLLNIPLHVLEVVMELCVGVEYLKFRSTCKLCHSAAPLIQCNNEKAPKRLQTYSLLSPLLMVFDKPRGRITFIDPVFGDKYFIKTPIQLLCDFEIKCARYGWLLILKPKHNYSLVFFNPFTNDIRELPRLGYSANLCFSAPPTSPNCMVVGLSILNVFIYFVSGEQSWRHVTLDINVNDSCFYRNLTFHGHDLFALREDGGLDVYKEMGREELRTCWEHAGPGPTSCCTSFLQSYQVRCHEHLLQVIVGKFGESVEVFKLKGFTQEWVKINGLGKHMIFISSASSLCIEARIPEMENKIYFPRLSSKSRNMVFYSLETCRYYTSDNKVIQEEFADFFGTKEFFTGHWIEPSWC